MKDKWSRQGCRVLILGRELAVPKSDLTDRKILRKQVWEGLAYDQDFRQPYIELI